MRPSSSAPSATSALGRRRITLLLRPVCGVGAWLSRTSSWAITSLPGCAPSAARLSVCAKRRAVGSPLPVRPTLRLTKVMFSPLPWVVVIDSVACAATP
ncbi:hypothetical protein G6F31_019065 [Rhizopus arrhizus]|nr:hypothetical protein G6F23_014212 [Rhizopus arrhizus]KAG0924585.1 hypothetical protein G6F31_019065 [Rhizopus arrhizus]